MILQSPPGAVPLIIKRPLLRSWTVCEILDLHIYHVIAMAEDGQLRFAFNVSRGAGRRRDLRILTKSVADFLAGNKRSGLSPEEEFQQAVKLIFPATSQTNGVTTIRAVNIYRRLSVDGTLVCKLIDDGLFVPAKGAVRRRGPYGSPAIRFDSVVRFLRERRVS